MENYPKLQKQFDELHQKAKEGIKFHSLMSLITQKENILLAVKNIKGNKGKNTRGTNNTVMQDLLDLEADKLIQYVRKRFRNYVPQTIRRKHIPKNNGKTRPLGIPTMEERLLQQCILQVLEPITEAKFVHQSFGFRPHRSVHHAQARVKNLLDTVDLSYAVDMDIQSFFDNVSHSKLIKQLYTLGIQDRQLLTIIKLMLKAKIIEPGFETNRKEIITPQKGTPQGGILSPLLANVVLNELDHWIVNQWENFEPRNSYTLHANKIKALRKTKLKTMYYVRYADDFRIFTTSYQEAVKIFNAVKMWLKERLNLQISEEKSQIVNLKKKNMQFLGILFKLRGNPKTKQHKVEKDSIKWVSYTSVPEETQTKIKEQIRERVIKIKYTFNKKTRTRAINNYNAYIRGLQFYSVVSKWSEISSKLTWNTRKIRYNRLKRIAKLRERLRNGKLNSGGFNKKRDRIFVNDAELLIPSDIKHKDLIQINPKLCKYTVEGRKLVHNERENNIDDLIEYLEQEKPSDRFITVAERVNRVSALAAQQGKCRLTDERLRPRLMEMHHRIPVRKDGQNATFNLVYLNTFAHKLIEAQDAQVIKNLYSDLKSSLSKPLAERKFLQNLNKYRELAGKRQLAADEL